MARTERISASLFQLGRGIVSVKGELRLQRLAIAC